MATTGINTENRREQYLCMKSDPVIAAYNNKITELHTLAPIRKVGGIDQPITLREDFQQAINQVLDERNSYINMNYGAIISSEFFDPLICRIMHIRQADRYIEFTIPPNLSMDNDQVLLYFNEDAVMTFERGKPGVLRGTIKDKEVFDYLIKRFKEL